ncbi:MAG: hypothetical protein J5585_07295 [Clostridia bacterium]|nr:hypothetical protein [Clostridia bacterium]
MKIQRLSQTEIAAYLTEEDAAELGIRADRPPDKDAAEIISGIARSELGFGFSASECTLECGYEDGYFVIRMRTRGGSHDSVLCFDDHALLKAACVCIADSAVHSELYGKDGTYFLRVVYKNGAFSGAPYEIASAFELCTDVYTDRPAFFYGICEHYPLLISENAVNDIAKSEKKW